MSETTGIVIHLVLTEAEEDGGYIAYARELPGCIAQGETEEEAEQNIRDVLDAYLSTLWERWQLERQDVKVVAGRVLREEARRVTLVPA